MTCTSSRRDPETIKLARLICPVQDETENVLKLCKDFQHAIRRMKRSMLACGDCAANQDCPVLINFQLAVNEAIGEIIEELGWEV